MDSRGTRSVLLSSGWNLIGHSANVSLELQNVSFINSSDECTANWSTAVAAGKMKAYLIYQDSGNKYVATPDLSMDSSTLEREVGYLSKVNVDDGGNYTLPNVGGAIPQESYAWSDLMFKNTTSGEVKNVTDAINATWVMQIGADQYFAYYYNDGETDLFRYIPDDKANLVPWEGYYIYSNVDGITINGCNYVTINGNVIIDNTSSGIGFSASDYSSITGNTCNGNGDAGNEAGIYMSDADNNVVTGNICYNNQNGIYINSTLRIR